MLQSRSSPIYPSPLERKHESPAHIQRSPVFASCSGGILSLGDRERIAGVPVASQEEVSPQERREELQGRTTIPRVPQMSQSIPGKPVFPALPQLSSRGSTHTTVARGTALWESLEGKPRGKASSESHRSLDPRDGKRDTAARAGEGCARACPHSRLGLTPLGRLQKCPKIHVSPGEESSGSATDSTQGLMPGSSPGGSREFEGWTALVWKDLFIY